MDAIIIFTTMGMLILVTTLQLIRTNEASDIDTGPVLSETMTFQVSEDEEFLYDRNTNQILHIKDYSDNLF